MSVLSDTERLLLDSIRELESVIGDHPLEPESVSLISLDLGISYEEQTRIICGLTALEQSEDLMKIYNEGNIYDYLRTQLLIWTTGVKNCDDIVIYSFIRAVAKRYIPELYLLSEYMKSDFEIVNAN